MLTKLPFDTQHEVSRQRVPGETLATVPVQQEAANASRWINEGTKGRRLRRQRRMERTVSHRVNGWTVRTW